MDSNSNLARASALITEVARILQDASGQQRTGNSGISTSNSSGATSSISAASPNLTASVPIQAQSSLTQRQATTSRLRYFTTDVEGSAQVSLNGSRNSTPESGSGRPAPATVISEFRSNFSPYSRTPTRQSTGTRSSISRNRNRLNEHFTRTFICLGGPSDTVTPNANRKAILTAAGLGQSMITLTRGSFGEELERALKSEFPRLHECGFGILRAVGSGQGKPFERLSRTQAIPTLEIIHSVRTGTIYIRPLLDLISADMDVAQADNSPESVQTAVAQQNPSEETPAPATIPTSSSSVAADGSDVENMEENDEPSEVASSALGHDLTSMEEYRRFIIRSAPGFQMIMIDRTMLLESMLGTYLKDPFFNFKQQTKVFFMNEPGRDVNALTKEYFTLGIKALAVAKFSGSHTLLEGELDYLLPTRDPMLKSAKYFTFLGKFMGHAAVHYGMAFVGFNSAAVRYIFNNGDVSELTLSTRDIPDSHAREIFKKLTDWADGTEPDDDDKERIGFALADCNIFVTPCCSNVHFLEQQFIEWHVITSRATFLDEIRDGIKSTGVFEFIKDREYLWSTVFPEESALRYSTAEILDVINYEHDGEFPGIIKEAFEEFISQLDPSQTRNLLQCWTGSPSLPSEGLEVKIVGEGSFIIHACFNQIEIPRQISKADLVMHLNLALQYAVYGFGAV